MAWYFNGQPKDEETHRGPGSSSLAAKREGGCHGHACDGSKICLSLNNTEVPSDISRSSFNTSTQTGGKRSVGVQSSAYGNMEEGRERRRALAIGREGEEDSSCARSPGSLTEYFSSLFDESFCSHQFKLVGSRILSSPKFQEEQVVNARDSGADLSLGSGGDGDRDGDGGDGGSSSCSLDSSGSSSDMVIGRASQISDGEPWGWFDEMDEGGGSPPSAPPVKPTPPYILTESLSAQRLWRETAGKRPRQPREERELFEELWAKNFSDSEVDYSAPLIESETAPSNDKNAMDASKVLYRATSPFGSAVSKSFMCDNCGQISSIMVHIPKFQIVQTGSDVHAEYLIVVGLGTVTLGVWRRFTEFKRLASKLSRSSRRDQFHNALCSWRCLKERQRWFRCLDRDYLILKTFLLERFLHDFIFESMSPNTVRDFLGVL